MKVTIFLLKKKKFNMKIENQFVIVLVFIESKEILLFGEKKRKKKKQGLRDIMV